MIEPPVVGELRRLRIKPRRQSREIGRAQRRRFLNHRTIDRRIEQVCKTLHGPVRCRHAAIDAQHCRCHIGFRPIGAHRRPQIERLVADAFQRGMCEFSRTSVAREAEQRAAHIGIPIGRAKADKGRHQIDRLRGIRLIGERPGFGGMFDDAEPVPQPLYGGARNEDRAFQRVSGDAIEPVGDRGEQLVLRGHRLGAGVEQREATGAVGRFHHAGREAGLADGRSLLVAGNAANGDAAAEQMRLAVAEMRRGILHLRQHRARHAQQRQ